MERKTTEYKDVYPNSDHDLVIELKVNLQNIVAGQIRLEQQIKELIQGQATALTQWETKSQIIHEAQDDRIKKLEALAIQYVPRGDKMSEIIETLRTEIQELKDGKNELVTGSRVVFWLLGATAGFASFIYLILQIVFHVKFM